jgi:hypothetical protein
MTFKFKIKRPLEIRSEKSLLADSSVIEICDSDLKEGRVNKLGMSATSNATQS